MSLPDLPVHPTPEQLAAYQEALSDTVDAWADDVEADVPAPAGPLPKDRNVWTELAYATPAQMTDLERRTKGADG